MHASDLFMKLIPGCMTVQYVLSQNGFDEHKFDLRPCRQFQFLRDVPQYCILEKINYTIVRHLEAMRGCAKCLTIVHQTHQKYNTETNMWVLKQSDLIWNC